VGLKQPMVELVVNQGDGDEHIIMRGDVQALHNIVCGVVQMVCTPGNGAAFAIRRVTVHVVGALATRAHTAVAFKTAAAAAPACCTAAVGAAGFLALVVRAHLAA